jgi:hypothetical protein
MNDPVVPIRISEACRRSSLSDWQIRAAIRRRDLAAIQVGKSWLIDPRSLDRMLSFEPRSVDPPGDAAA